MYSLKKSILFGFLVWLIPFAVAFLIFPIRESNRPLFESIMPVVLTFVVVLFSSLYFKNVEKNVRSEGIKLGIIFLLISLLLDLILFMPKSPMQMGFVSYLSDIGFTYLIIPIITVSFSNVFERKNNN